MAVSVGDCNVYQGIGSSAMLSWIFTPSFDAIGQLQKMCIIRVDTHTSLKSHGRIL